MLCAINLEVAWDADKSRQPNGAACAETIYNMLTSLLDMLPIWQVNA